MMPYHLFVRLFQMFGKRRREGGAVRSLGHLRYRLGQLFFRRIQILDFVFKQVLEFVCQPLERVTDIFQHDGDL